ncbi:uncharacterized protein PEZ65_008334 [Lycodopsis pacificus]
MTILEPLEITDTHVVVKVLNLTAFGLVWDIVRKFLNVRLPGKGQVLLFLRPPHVRDQILNVFLLQENIHVDECKLFDSTHGPNFHPTFEVFLTPNTERVTLSVQDEERKVVWKRLVLLEGPRAEIQQRNVSAEGVVTADMKLFSVQIQFVQKVSIPSLNDLLDNLFERRVITDAEMESAKTKNGADRARDVIDTVRKKGSDASSGLISALREVDLCLYTALFFS